VCIWHELTAWAIGHLVLKRFVASIPKFLHNPQISLPDTQPNPELIQNCGVWNKSSYNCSCQ